LLFQHRSGSRPPDVYILDPAGCGYGQARASRPSPSSPCSATRQGLAMFASAASAFVVWVGRTHVHGGIRRRRRPISCATRGIAWVPTAVRYCLRIADVGGRSSSRRRCCGRSASSSLFTLGASPASAGHKPASTACCRRPIRVVETSTTCCSSAPCSRSCRLVLLVPEDDGALLQKRPAASLHFWPSAGSIWFFFPQQVLGPLRHAAPLRRIPTRSRGGTWVVSRSGATISGSAS